MGTVRLLARCDLRRRWRSTVALALLLGAIGTVILATAAGARRSDLSLGRFNADSRSSDVEISIGKPTAAQLRAFRRAPEVAAMALVHGYSLGVDAYPDLAIAAPDDDAMGNVVDRARLITGRYANPAAADEVTMGEALAKELHLRIGSHLDSTSYTQAQIKIGFSGGEAGPPAGPRVSFRVVGIVRRPLDLGVRSASGGIVLLTPAFNAQYKHRLGLYTDVLRIKTVAGAADVQRVVAAARKLWGTQETFRVTGLNVETEGARSAIDVLTLALWIFAGVTTLAGVVAVAIVLSRDIARATVDQSTLHALGTSRIQRIAAGSARALIIAGVGASLAGLGAVFASPLFPLGIARRADPDVGLHADWPVLAIGIALLAIVVVTVAILAAWRVTRSVSPDRTARVRRRTSPAVETAARAGLPPAAINGLRMALEPGRGESSVPIRSAFAGAVFGIAGITAVLVFAASLAHLVATPKLAGWNWDLKAEVPTGDDPHVKCVDQYDLDLTHTRGVEALAAVCLQSIEVGGRPVAAWGFESLRGDIDPEIVAGRAPRGPKEIALGSVTLRELHKHIGDTVKARGDGGENSFVVVGRIALPSLSEPEPLADGASFTASGLKPLIVKGENESHFLLLRFAPGADRSPVSRILEKFARGARAHGVIPSIGGPTTPVEIERLQQINWFPAILAALLATLALIAVGHALVTSVRRRRRELALLKTIGFNRRQVSATVAWQATTIAIVGLVVGIPAGVLIGRAVWRAVANGLGVATGATLPTLGLLLTVVAALVLVNVLAFLPGRAAANTRPAVALRSE